MSSPVRERAEAVASAALDLHLLAPIACFMLQFCNVFVNVI